MANPFFTPIQNQVAPAIGNLNQAILGYGQLRQQQENQRKQDEAKAELEQGMMELDEAFQNEDYDKLARLSIKYPQISQQLTQALGAKNERTKQNAISALSQLFLNPDDYENILGERKQLIIDEGGNPIDTEQFIQTFRENPELARKMTAGYLSLVAPEQYNQLKKVVEPEDAITPYQKAKLEIDRGNLEIRKTEAEINKLKTKQADETNELKKKELQLKVDKLEKENQKKQNELDAESEKIQVSSDRAQETVSLIDKILNSENFNDVVGTFDTFTPVLSGESQDLVNDFSRLESLLTVDNLKLMTGVLTDRDIQFLSRVAGGLNITEKGVKGSEEGVRKRLDQIKNKLKGNIPKGEQVATTQDTGGAVETDNFVDWGDL